MVNEAVISLLGNTAAHLSERITHAMDNDQGRLLISETILILP
jgi:hypothetical protein